MAKSADRPAPWKRAATKKKSAKRPRKMTREQIGEARARAQRAGRPYPNLVDNMAVSRPSKKKKKSGAKRRAK
jgi:hypothetical protein